jgi:hypothetical protein
MIHILSLELKSGDYYEDIMYEGTEEEFRKALDNNTYIMFKGLDDVNHLIPAEKIETIEYLQTKIVLLDHNPEGCEDECCCCPACCEECGAPLDDEDDSEDDFFPNFIEEDGSIDYDKLLGYVQDEFIAMGVSLCHWSPATQAISEIATKVFGHFDSFAPGLSTEAKNEVIFDAVGYASELLDSEDIKCIVDDKMKADLKDRIMVGCTSALVTDFI